MNQENQDFTPESGENSTSGVAGIREKLQQLLEKFREFPPKMQFIIIGGFVFFLLIIFSGGGDTPEPQSVKQKVQANQQQNQQRKTNTTRADALTLESDDPFSQINPERGKLQKRYFEKQAKETESRLNTIEASVDNKMSEVKDLQESIVRLTKKLDQKMENFNEQMEKMQQINSGSLEEIRKIAEESKNKNIQSGGNSQRGGGYQQGGGYNNQGRSPTSGKNKPIKQIILQQDSSANTNMGQPLLGGLVKSGVSPQAIQDQMDAESFEAPPFIPPLGFIRGTLLNGFDALAGAGTPTPALVRLSGSYKTAMNSSVNLNGCFMLVEFEGDLSTERAFGTPARMTCVYPDHGAVTYDVAGYVVDEKDGIVGIPGIFYEGDPTRLASAMIADFTAAIADVVNSNQSSSTQTTSGATQTAITGSETKAELAAGVSSAVGGLRDYLSERANRIVPFVRVDATRDLHLVILEGVELRHQGKPWTLLVGGEKVDALEEVRKQKIDQLRRSQQSRR